MKKNLRERNTLTAKEKVEVGSYSKEINTMLGITQFDNPSVRGLADTSQTHGLYGIYDNELDFWKTKLEQLGANKFRTVKACGNLVILCFNAENMFEDFIMTSSY